MRITNHKLPPNDPASGTIQIKLKGGGRGCNELENESLFQITDYISIRYNYTVFHI